MCGTLLFHVPAPKHTWGAASYMHSPSFITQKENQRDWNVEDRQLQHVNKKLLNKAFSKGKCKDTKQTVMNQGWEDSPRSDSRIPRLLRTRDLMTPVLMLMGDAFELFFTNSHPYLWFWSSFSFQNLKGWNSPLATFCIFEIVQTTVYAWGICHGFSFLLSFLLVYIFHMLCNNKTPPQNQRFG